jgi:hypothetical protein
MREIDMAFDEARETGDAGMRERANAALKRLEEHVESVTSEIDRIHEKHKEEAS